MSCSVLHHVELCVGDHRKTLELLCNGYGFQLFAQRTTPQADTWVLKAGQAVFLITKRKHLKQSAPSDYIKDSLDHSVKECIQKSENNFDYEQSGDIHLIENNHEINLKDVRKNTHNRFEKNLSRENTDENQFNNIITKPLEHLLEHSTLYPINLFSSANCYNDEHWTCFCCRDSDVHTIDSVFNVSLIVKDVDSITNCIRKSNSGKVLREPCNIQNKDGTVRYSIVSSVCGNIVHTLIDKRKYNGFFLPGYDLIHSSEPILKLNLSNKQELCESSNDYQFICKQFNNLDDRHLETEDLNSRESNNITVFPIDSLLGKDHMEDMKEKSIQNNKSVIEENINFNITENSKTEHIPKPSSSSVAETPSVIANQISHIDHVTFVCAMGSSASLMEWYEQCFGMKRFITNRQESDTEGFVLAGDIGLRLKAMEYWRCAETGLAPPDASLGDSSFKLVIAEALPDVPHSNVDSFLSAHGGPGVQHIGLHTPHILETVETIANRGVKFRKPPPTYYQEVGKLSEITAAGFGSEVHSFQDLGILIDTEADVFTRMDEQDGRYLMQIFSLPIFGVESFFLEIVQRYGAQGFGQGNIAALARSIQLYQKQQENKQQSQ